MRPSCIMMVRSPMRRACSRLWVTMSVVSRYSATIRFVSSSTCWAVLGSSAAVCSSSSRSDGRRHGGHDQRQGLALAAGQEAHLALQPVFQAEAQRGQKLPVAGAAGRGDAPPQSTALAPAARPCSGSPRWSWRRRSPGAGPGTPARCSRRRRCSLQRVMSTAVQDDAAPVGEVAAGDQVEQGRLARAVAADDGDELPLFDGEVHPVHGDLDAAPAHRETSWSAP